MSDPRATRFRALYDEHFDAVLGFALRRADRSEDAADVTADTFLVLWRRLDHAPEDDAVRPWLYGVARRTLANQRRGEGRRAALGQRLREQLATATRTLDPADDVAQRADLAFAMARLSARDEEVLQLHLWEGLESREIAEVLGLTVAVVRPRLSRARSRLRDLLGNDPPPAGHLLNDGARASSTTHRPQPSPQRRTR